MVLHNNINKSKRIVLGITGSIAAYKSITIAQMLLKLGYEIDIVLSKSAPLFVPLLTLRTLFPGRVFCWDDDLNDADQIIHIKLAYNADLILIAPASAQIIAALAGGFADCLLTSLCLAYDHQIKQNINEPDSKIAKAELSNPKIFLAPAMNTVMWKNPVTQENIMKLRNRNFEIIVPDIGKQACGAYGFGRIPSPSAIINYIQNCHLPKLLLDKKIVITASSTIEQIDPVRFLSCYGSGRMGYALAEIAAYMGAIVILIGRKTHLPLPQNCSFCQIKSADEMLNASLQYCADADVFISAAAVADYKVKYQHNHKIKKQTNELKSLELIQNPDIVSSIKTRFPGIFCVGFAAETENILENARQKLYHKKLDMIVANSVANNEMNPDSDTEIIAQNAFGNNSEVVILHNVYQDEKFVEKLLYIGKNSKKNIVLEILNYLSQNLLK